MCLQDGSVQCQHGPAECRLDRVINCAAHLFPGQAAWLPFVTCLEGAPRDAREKAVAGCAEGAGMDPSALLHCAESEEGAALERAAEAETAAVVPQHRYVPWVTVNGVPLGTLDDRLALFVCVAYLGRRPDACYEPPSSSAIHAPDLMGRRSKAA
jgi:interferon gamma-inducible protein 30